MAAEIARLQRAAAEREAVFQRELATAAAARERAEREAEAARERVRREAAKTVGERAVREAEAARERAERDAEAARERAEREAEAVRERAEAVRIQQELLQKLDEKDQKLAEKDQELRERDLFTLRDDALCVPSVLPLPLSASRSSRSSSHSSVRARAPWLADATGASVFHGLTNCDSSVLAAINDGIKGLSVPLPKKRDDESTVVHARLTAVFELIQQKLLAAGLPCLQWFHESNARAGSDNERPDWVFTLPCETAPFTVNVLFYVEAKAVSTRSPDMSRAR